MVVSDFLNLTDAEYASRIRGYSDSQLHEQLKVKGTQVKVGRAVKISGALFSFTGKLVGNVIDDDIVVPMVLGSISRAGGRRVVLSTQKIRLIQEELQRRQLEHEKIQNVVEAPPAYEKAIVCETRNADSNKLIVYETRNDDSNKAIVRETRNDDSNVAMREATHPTFGHSQPPRKEIDHVHTRGGSPKSRSFLAFRGNLWLLFWMMIALIVIFRPF
ncbi:hypothetical protein HBI25_015810 [Parastagonospora nodorum]|nr:hypothetical protein HBH53_019440 [Parastagonospora nodorum]KAH3977279.1 hypothetical protein HBH52_113850 [Parastagonospora nodorum]KAH4027658.1 hypothetical protein HBI09_141540 [Parastagonospora nodorum]KAH4051337.1 hypothetical protein HBH49_116250 [Parastagonospora nodorum]KAH4103237.1 hypothetical protein HBH46_116660 [Parastagonospora nodorum]